MLNKVVLDTNCLIMALSRHSEFHPVWTGIQTGKYILCVSNDILEEYHEIITQKTSIVVADNVIRLLSECTFVEYIDPHYHLELIQTDPDDNKFVDCAFAANASYIVSNDKHFDALKSIDFPKIQVLKLIEFLQTLR
ncbi:MAG: putative toxin-antitoxin system toxin component, PIN family [Paludibacteraceae bacterium]|nr:putative toxin-antitoxin system toxin component, PIN family [Paludibacteraceae bacterium]MBQ6764849.1 putative toxin-antitoxin system toxin component, PIN family [Paludibacteraceae bacterium]